MGQQVCSLPAQRAGWKVPCIGGPFDGQMTRWDWPDAVPAEFDATYSNPAYGQRVSTYRLEMTGVGPRFVYVEPASRLPR